ncbi:MAG: gluconeogenesis factor YvcK family protein [Candidatus Woesearchaeota archaeon]|jgi:uncharacterized cofD-like protein
MKRVVTLGGGTGSFVVLNSLKNHPVELCAIVSMADDGGSTGILRDELGVLPPGDVRQCLIALSDSSRLMRSLMNYRFENGGLQGHSFGNLLLSALEKTTGSFEKAVEEAGKILNIKGKVIPITTHQTRLKMLLNSGRLLEGEGEIYISTEVHKGFKSIYLEPFPKADPHAIDEIMNADLIILGPGGLYTSLIPNLLVEGIPKALRESKAKKLFIVNLMNKNSQNPEFKASHYLQEIVHYLGKDCFDYILINSGRPSKELIHLYSEEGDLVENDLSKDSRIVYVDLIENQTSEYSSSDVLSKKRALIRHDPKKLSQAILKILEEV